MPTNIDDYGNYPLPDYSLTPFEQLWKEELSMAPEVPMNWREAEVFKQFARRVFDAINVDERIQKIANEAYHDGNDDGWNESEDKLKERLIQTVQEAVKTFV